MSTSSQRLSTMLGFGRKSHTGSKRSNKVRGLQAAINNSRTTADGRAGAKSELKHMGVKPNKPSLGTRIRHLFGLPGRSHRRNSARPVHHH